MANMGYCRFRNTLKDLEDCVDHMADPLADEEEMQAREYLILVCASIAADYAPEEEDD